MTASAAGGNTIGVSTIGGSINEKETNNTQLMTLIQHIRQEREMLFNRVKLMQAESADKEETLSAITDSNRRLREEKEKVEKDNESLKVSIAEAEALKGPMEDKLKQNEERVNTLVVEKLALQAEVERWKTRSDQLEKSFKINQKELQRLQESETRLTKTVAGLETEKKTSDAKMNSVSKEMDLLKAQASSFQAEKTKLNAESSEKNKELAQAKTENVQSKHIQSNLQKEINGLKNKTKDLVKIHNTEMAKIKKEADESKSSRSDEVTTIKKQMEDALEKLKAEEKKVKSLSTENNKLKEDQNKVGNINQENKRNLRDLIMKSKLETMLPSGRRGVKRGSGSDESCSGL